MDQEKPNILFLCTGNSCRSQMAESWAKHHFAAQANYYSAGIEKHGLNKNMLKVMSEKGVDLTGAASKTLSELDDIQFDYVFTVCQHADQTCPTFPSQTQVIHVGFDDPPKLAKEASTQEEAIEHYRRVRNEIEDFILSIEEKYLAMPLS